MGNTIYVFLLYKFIHICIYIYMYITDTLHVPIQVEGRKKQNQIKTLLLIPYTNYYHDFFHFSLRTKI